MDSKNPKSEGDLFEHDLYRKCDSFNPFSGNIADEDYTRPGLEAGRALREIGDPAYKILLDILKDKNIDIEKRKDASWVLMGVYQPSMKELFINILADKTEDFYIRNHAATGLGAIDDAEVRNLYCRIIQDEKDNQDIRSNILSELWKCSHRR